MERGTISGMQKAARWPDFLPVPHSASLFRASSGAGPRHASTAGLPQKLIVLAACNSKFGTQRVSIRIIVEQDAKTRAPHLHNSNLLEQNLQQLRNSTWLRFTSFRPSIGGLVLRGIQAFAKVRALVHQRCKELRSRLLQVPNVVEGQFVRVVVERDHFFACASPVQSVRKCT